MISTDTKTSRIIYIDTFCDRCPLISTITNISHIALKILIHITCTAARIDKTPYFAYVSQKSIYRCLTLLVPVLGNVIIYSLDQKATHAAPPLPKPEAPLKPQVIKPEIYSQEDLEELIRTLATNPLSIEGLEDSIARKINGSLVKNPYTFLAPLRWFLNSPNGHCNSLAFQAILKILKKLAQFEVGSLWIITNSEGVPFKKFPGSGFEIAQVCIKSRSVQTLEHIEYFHLTDSELIALAKEFVLISNPLEITRGALLFLEMASNPTKTEIAKICLASHPFIEDRDITERLIKGELTDLDCKKIATAIDHFIVDGDLYSPTLLLNYLKTFKTPRQIYAWLAKECAQLNGEWTVKHMRDFDLGNDPQIRFEIATFCMRENVAASSLYIREFQLQDPQDLIALVKLAISLDLASLAHHLPHSVLENYPEERLEIAELCALRGFDYMLPHWITKCDLRIDFPKETEELFWPVLERGSASLSCAHEFGFSDCFISNELIGTTTSFKEENELTLDPFQQWVEAHTPFSWLLPTILSIGNLEMRRKTAINAAAILFLFYQKLNQDQLQWIEDQGLLKALFSLKAPHLRFPNALAIVAIAEREESRNLFENFALRLEEKYPWVPLIKAHIVALSAEQGISHRALAQLIHHLNHQGYILFKDVFNAKLLISTLKQLRKNKNLSTQEKNRILNHLNQQFSGEIFLDSLKSLSVILDLNQENLLRTNFTNLIDLAEHAFQETIHLAEVENIYQKTEKTFGSSRNPLAIWNYTAKINQLHKPENIACLADYIKAVLEGTFLNERYSLEKNAHLAKISAPTLDQWKEGLSFSLTDQNLSSPALFDPFNWLYTKLIVDKHMSLEKMPSLEAFLKGNKEDPAQIPGPFSPIENLCIELTKAKTREKHIEILSDLCNQLLSAEFLNDARGKINEMRPSHSLDLNTLRAIETDNPYDLLLCGTEVHGSCQRVDGNPSLNQGLLGYLMNGQVRLAAIVDPKGVILGRAIIRLLLDKDNNPVIFMDRYYGAPELENGVIEIAKEKAKKLHVSLTTKSGQGPRYEKKLLSLGGRAPIEYCDAIEGLAEASAYEIYGTRIIS